MFTYPSPGAGFVRERQRGMRAQADQHGIEEIRGQLVRRGWARKDAAYEICAHGPCDVTPRRSAS